MLVVFHLLFSTAKNPFTFLSSQVSGRRPGQARQRRCRQSRRQGTQNCSPIFLSSSFFSNHQKCAAEVYATERAPWRERGALLCLRVVIGLQHTAMDPSCGAASAIGSEGASQIFMVPGRRTTTGHKCEYEEELCSFIFCLNLAFSSHKLSSSNICTTVERYGDGRRRRGGLRRQGWRQ